MRRYAELVFVCLTLITIAATVRLLAVQWSANDALAASDTSLHWHGRVSYFQGKSTWLDVTVYQSRYEAKMELDESGRITTTKWDGVNDRNAYSALRQAFYAYRNEDLGWGNGCLSLSVNSTQVGSVWCSPTHGHLWSMVSREPLIVHLANTGQERLARSELCESVEVPVMQIDPKRLQP